MARLLPYFEEKSVKFSTNYFRFFTRFLVGVFIISVLFATDFRAQNIDKCEKIDWILRRTYLFLIPYKQPRLPTLYVSYARILYGLRRGANVCASLRFRIKLLAYSCFRGVFCRSLPTRSRRIQLVVRL